MKLEIHTLRFGNPEWLPPFAASLEDYYMRHDEVEDLFIWDDTPRGYPCPKFCLIDMLRSFLGRDSTHFLYIDADVFIAPDAPLPDLSKPGLYVFSDGHHARHTSHWIEWCKEHFGRDYTMTYPGYFNAGIFACDRDAAQMILNEAVPPYVEFFQDQHCFNKWVHEATMRGMPVNQLGYRWNAYGAEAEPGSAWFYHCWGDNKLGQLARIQ